MEGIMEELIDLLDENGNMIGTIDKAIAHRDGLWHKSVHIWMVNDKNEILLQHRCAEKNFFPNFWDCLFAGHVGAGEESIESVLREGKEEIGLNLQKDEVKHLFRFKEHFEWGNIVSNEFVDVFLIRKNYEIDKDKFQKEEVDGLKWVKLSQFFKMIDEGDKTLIPHTEEYKKLKDILL